MMKKILIIILLLFLAVPVYAKEEPKIAIAVIDFKPLGVSASDSIFASEFFRVALVSSGKFRVVEKANMDKILAEQGFQQTGCTTQECAVQMGKLLNLRNIVTGSFGKFGDMYQIITGLVNVETGEIVFSDNASCKTINEVSFLTNELVSRLVDHLTGKPGTPAPALGRLSIVTDPPYSTIRIDRAEVGSSDGSGKFEYEKLKADINHTVEVSREGYETEVKEVIIGPGGSRGLTFVLREKIVFRRETVYEKARKEKERAVYERKKTSRGKGLMRIKGGILMPAGNEFEKLFGDSYSFGFDAIGEFSDFLSICWKNNLTLNFITNSPEKPLEVENASFYMYSTILGLQLSFNIKGFIPYAGLGMKLNVMLEEATFSDYSDTDESLAFVAYGLELSGGLKIMFSKNFGIFAEVSTASTKTGPAKIDIDGLTGMAGMIFMSR